ncbi:MAG: AbfB domain-containing protein, partial [Pseudonocardiaceae bacterium]
AFDGSVEQQKAFLDNGLLAAKQQDQKDSIDADKKATEADKARLAARNAKANAASVVLLPVDDALLNLSDDNFIRKVTDKAAAGSEVSNAAWMALRSTTPADWAAFITTGIYDANKRDIDIARGKKADEDRRITTELKTRAENGLMQPRLVAAAAAALAGSDEDVAAFLQDGQYAVLAQSLQTTTPGVKGWYVRSAGGNAWITPGKADPNGTTVLDAANWKVVAGLADPNCFSLESTQFPGSYLGQNNFRVQLAANDGTAVFKNDATWRPRPGLSGSDVSLESKALPGRFLRHAHQQLWAANNSGQNWFDTSLAFEDDSTWRIVNPDPEISTLSTLRWYNDDAFRAAVGNPTSAEVYVDGVRYRDHEKGRVYWSQDTDVHFVSGDILTKYLSLGGGKSTLPITDTSSTSDGIGRYNHFAPDDPKIGGISIFWSPSTGPHLVYGLIRDRWEQLGWEKSYLGYPTSDESAIPGGRRSTFQHGNIDYNSATGKITDYRV